MAEQQGKHRVLPCTCASHLFHPPQKLWNFRGGWNKWEAQLFVFNQFGDLERCALRPGNVHSANGWCVVLEPVVSRYRDRKLRRYIRADGAFASPEVYEFLEAEGFLYAIRLPANRVLQECIAHLLTRPVGRPPKEVRRYHASFSYKAQS